MAAATAEDDAFKSFECPITYSVMEDAATCIHGGQSYERAAIMEMVAGLDGRPCLDPLTRLRFDPNDIQPNRGLQSAIDEVLQKRRAEALARSAANALHSAENAQQVRQAWLVEQAKVKDRLRALMEDMGFDALAAAGMYCAILKETEPAEPVESAPSHGGWDGRRYRSYGCGARRCRRPRNYTPPSFCGHVLREVAMNHNTDMRFQGSAVLALELTAKAHLEANHRHLVGIEDAETRDVLRVFLKKLIRHASLYTEFSDRKTVTALDVVKVLKRQSQGGFTDMYAGAM
jgi:hypothetical protein